MLWTKAADQIISHGPQNAVRFEGTPVPLQHAQMALGRTHCWHTRQSCSHLPAHVRILRSRSLLQHCKQGTRRHDLSRQQIVSVPFRAAFCSGKPFMVSGRFHSDPRRDGKASSASKPMPPHLRLLSAAAEGLQNSP